MNEPQRKVLVGLLFGVGALLSFMAAAVLCLFIAIGRSQGAIQGVFFVAPLLVVSALVLSVAFSMRTGGKQKAGLSPPRARDRVSRETKKVSSFLGGVAVVGFIAVCLGYVVQQLIVSPTTESTITSAKRNLSDALFSLIGLFAMLLWKPVQDMLPDSVRNPLQQVKKWTLVLLAWWFTFLVVFSVCVILVYVYLRLTGVSLQEAPPVECVLRWTAIGAIPGTLLVRLAWNSVRDRAQSRR